MSKSLFRKLEGLSYFEIKKAIFELSSGRELNFNEKLLLEMSYRKHLISIEGKCRKCHHTERLTLDHIIPLMLLEMMGFDKTLHFDEDNLSLLCKRCNMFKSNKLDFTDERTKPLLQKYLDLVPQIMIVQPALFAYAK